MKKLKKVFSLVLSILLFTTILTVGGVFTKEVKADTVPVKLYYAKLVQGTYGTSTTGYIAVKNIAYNKNVTVHYSTTNGVTGQDVSASYLRTNTDGYEVWSFNIPEVAGQFYTENTFSINYVVNGQTYTDNNGGNNYKASKDYYGISPAFGKSNVFLDFADITTYNGLSELKGYVRVNDSFANPNIKIRYTTNNWQSYNDVSCSSSTGYGFFNINLQWADLNKVHYAVCYTVNGVEYWDNNFGINYDAKTY